VLVDCLALLFAAAVLAPGVAAQATPPQNTHTKKNAHTHTHLTPPPPPRSRARARLHAAHSIPRLSPVHPLVRLWTSACRLWARCCSPFSPMPST
jgi:hypothetical protein